MDSKKMLKHCVLWLMILVLDTQVGHGDTICRDSDKYAIGNELLKLRTDEFSEEQLRSILGSYVAGPESEMFIFATSDRGLRQKMAEVPSLVESGRPRGLPLKISGPMAYFFRIDGNVFFQYGDRKTYMRWVTLRGANVLSKEIGGVKVLFGNQSFVSGTTESCDSVLRQLYVVVENLRKLPLTKVLRIAAYYDELFPRPVYFHLTICESIAGPDDYRYVFPSLLSTWRREPKLHSGQMRIIHTRYPVGDRVVDVFDGATFLRKVRWRADEWKTMLKEGSNGLRIKE